MLESLLAHECEFWEGFTHTLSFYLLRERLAMIGFVAAIAVELFKGQDLFAQISEGGIPWFIGTSILLSVASLVPLFKGGAGKREKPLVDTNQR